MADEWGDFSHHRPIDVRDYAARGYTTLGWKVTEDFNYVDPTFPDAYRIARSLGLRFVGYAFLRNATPGNAQADHLIDTWEDVAAGRLRHDLDVICADQEDTQTPTRAAAVTRAFAQRCVERGYEYGVIYSGRWYAQPYGVRLDDVPAGWRYGWLSDYTTNQDDSAIELPSGWSRAQVVARQYTSTHAWPGQPPGVDFNRTLQPWPAGDEEDEVALTRDETMQALRDVLRERPREGATTAYEAFDRVTSTLGVVRSNAGELEQLGSTLATAAAGIASLLTRPVAQVAAAELAAALAPLLEDVVPALAPEDLDRIARAVNDELARRQIS